MTIKMTLDEPIEGYEDKVEWKTVNEGDHVMDGHGGIFIAEKGGGYVAHVLTPKVKKYDWDKTDGRVLVVNHNHSAGIVQLRSTPYTPKKLSTEWIPHNGGNCPFDEEAVIVEVRLRNETIMRFPACKFVWEYESSNIERQIISTRFVELAEGYEW